MLQPAPSTNTKGASTHAYFPQAIKFNPLLVTNGYFIFFPGELSITFHVVGPETAALCY